jgi:hypothetical protein
MKNYENIIKIKENEKKEKIKLNLKKNSIFSSFFFKT